MLEICGTCLTPEIVLKTSGHVAKFEDLMVKDLKKGTHYRIDKLIESVIQKKLNKKGLNEKKKQELMTLMTNIECLSPEEIY